MSWDVVVMKYREPPPPVAELPSDFAPEPLGTTATIRAAIDAAFPNVDWSDPVWGIFDLGGFSLEFVIGEAESTNSFSVYVRGTGDPISPLLRLARDNGWYVLDMQIPEWFHHCSDPSASWHRFQGWRDRVLDRNPEE